MRCSTVWFFLQPSTAELGFFPARLDAISLPEVDTLT
jgi:hypothetical protein